MTEPTSLRSRAPSTSASPRRIEGLTSSRSAKDMRHLGRQPALFCLGYAVKELSSNYAPGSAIRRRFISLRYIDPHVGRLPRRSRLLVSVSAER